MSWRRDVLPDQERRDSLLWSIDNGGHDFWSLVDSTPQWSPGRSGCTEDCRNGSGNDDCSIYTHRRGRAWCIAARSDRDQCGHLVIRGTPFCPRHFKKAWDVLCVAVAETETDLLRRNVESARFQADGELDRMAARLGIEKAILDDLALVATRLPERVYFFAAGSAVKIGRSINPEKRVKTLGTTKAPDGTNFAEGVLLGTIPGGCRVESELHGRFGQHRLVGEWFELEPIRTQIEALIADFKGAAA